MLRRYSIHNFLNFKTGDLLMTFETTSPVNMAIVQPLNIHIIIHTYTCTYTYVAP